MKIACLCPTFNRPAELAEALACFEAQTYPDRELVVLDDAGQYEEQAGDRWRLVSFAPRFPALGAKRNYCATLPSREAEVLAVWDDDDIYLPWHLEALAEAFRKGAAWVKPDQVWAKNGVGNLVARPAVGLCHPGCAFRREVFDWIGGYPPNLSSGEDCDLAGRLVRTNRWPAAPRGRPSLHCRWYNASPHLGAGGAGKVLKTGYSKRAAEGIQRVPGPLRPSFSRDWLAALPVEDK